MDRLQPYGVDYFRPFLENEEHEAIQWFLTLMRERNADVDEEEKTFSLTVDNKLKLFSDRYNEFQSAIHKMTLEDFANGNTAWNLQNIIEDRLDDLVLNQYEEVVSYDSFCRTLMPDTKYIVIKAYNICR